MVAALRLSPGIFSVLFRTLKRAIQGRPFAWDKLERTAAVKYVPRSAGIRSKLMRRVCGGHSCPPNVCSENGVPPSRDPSH